MTTVTYDASCLNKDDTGQNSAVVCKAIASQAVCCMQLPETGVSSCIASVNKTQCGVATDTTQESTIIFTED